MMASVSPFPYTAPVAPADLIDRDEEAETLLDRARERLNSRLSAPRRFGKTSLLRRVLRDAENEDWATVYVDFFGVLTLGDVADRIERAYARQLQGPLAAWFSGARRLLKPTARLGGGPVPAGLEVALDSQAEPPLLDRLALPVRLHQRHGVRTLVVFDEFPDVLGASARADAVVRSEIQHHADVASYIFAGSHVGMMRQLFGDRRRALYGQAAPLELSALRADEVASYVADRFAETGRDPGVALDGLLDLAAGHPQRTMLLAHLLWEETGGAGTATEETWQAVLDRVARELHDEHRAIWIGLGSGQRRVLAAVAANAAPLYSATRHFGGSRGGAVGAAVRQLLDRGEVVEDTTTATGYRVVDPLLAAWVRAGRPEE